MESIYKLAKKYYPLLWHRERLDALLAAGKLTQEEYEEIVDPARAEAERLVREAMKGVAT